MDLDKKIISVYKTVFEQTATEETVTEVLKLDTVAFQLHCTRR